MIGKSRIELLGCYIDNLSMEETLEKIETIIKEKIPRQHVVLNAGKINRIQKDSNLKQIVNSCEIINADGMAVVWASRVLGRPLKGRVAGIDLMLRLIEEACKKKYRLYFLGAREEVLSAVVGKYLNLYPDLNIAGYRNGYWAQEEELDIVKEINRTKPDILFVGISSPKKEEFLNKYLVDLDVPFSMGVGGSFDVLAGETSRAPRWLQSIGLEWLFRLIQEPRRLWKRYLIGNVVFIWLVLKEKLKKKSSTSC